MEWYSTNIKFIAKLVFKRSTFHMINNVYTLIYIFVYLFIQVSFVQPFDLLYFQ